MNFFNISFGKRRKSLVLFATAGVIGFLVDAGVLHFTSDLLGLYFGRVLSFFAAVVATWLFNKYLTFVGRKSGLGIAREFLAYVLLMLGGGLVNYGIYAWLISTYQLIHNFPTIGVGFGSLGGMLINYLSSKFILYRHLKQFEIIK